jgi:hypothetical protein
MTPITSGAAADVLPVLPAEAELAGDEEEAELHPASARAPMTIAGNAARAPVRRDRVIDSLPFLAGPSGSGSRRGAD